MRRVLFFVCLVLVGCASHQPVVGIAELEVDMTRYRDCMIAAGAYYCTSTAAASEVADASLAKCGAYGAIFENTTRAYYTGFSSAALQYRAVARAREYAAEAKDKYRNLAMQTVIECRGSKKPD